MKILVACEFSGVVREEFKKLGHEAWSCDLEPTEIEGNHYQGNVFDILNNGWDMMIAHPPCTYLTVSGNKWFKEEYKNRFPTREQDRLKAIDFFMKLINAPIPKIAIENPIGIMSTIYKKPTQIIQPYQFGHSATKATCLWLKNLPKLQPTNIVDKGDFVVFKSGKRMSKWYAEAAKNKTTRAKIRNKTFQGVAKAMAEQWSL
jgi:hypothetical protein